MTALRISRPACTDLHEIVAYVGERDPHTALKLVSTLLARIEVLRTHPQIGRMGRVAGTRELVIPDTRYIAAYRVEPSGDITVLRVLHTARRWPRSFLS